jgi:hypothetical protein
MNRIKSFSKLFESKELYIEKVCSLYEDIKSIGYTLEDEGYDEPEYQICVVCVPHGTLQKEIRTITIRNSNSIVDFLTRPTYVLRDFRVCIKNTNKDDEKQKINVFKEEVGKYLELFKLHMDYVPEKYITKELWHSKYKFFNIKISSEYFMK